MIAVNRAKAARFGIAPADVNAAVQAAVGGAPIALLMACFSVGLGLLPAAVINSIGAQVRQPLARVVVGGMCTTVLAVLLLIPLMASMRFAARVPDEDAESRPIR